MFSLLWSVTIAHKTRLHRQRFVGSSVRIVTVDGITKGSMLRRHRSGLGIGCLKLEQRCRKIGTGDDQSRRPALSKEEFDHGNAIDQAMPITLRYAGRSCVAAIKA